MTWSCATSGHVTFGIPISGRSSVRNKPSKSMRDPSTSLFRTLGRSRSHNRTHEAVLSRSAVNLSVHTGLRLYAADAVEWYCVENPIYNIEQDESHREHSTRDLVHLASLLPSIGVEVARWLASITAVLDHVDLCSIADIPLHHIHSTRQPTSIKCHSFIHFS